MIRTVEIMNILRHLPAVHQLQAHERFSELLTKENISASVLTKWLNDEINTIRNKLLKGDITDETLTREDLTSLIFKGLDEKVITLQQPHLQKVINATGVVLHTNLGRARLSNEAIEQITTIASSYSTLEFNINTGQRGSRHDIVEEYLQQLTGAEAALVVNNNAAAVYLVLKAMANEAEVIVSRGELVEIGGSFRVSEIMEESNATLIEVGTSNKTYVSDYEKAITEETALLMKVHKSNFKIVGFTAEVDTEDLVALSKRKNIPIYEDLGSGTLFDFKKEQIGAEPTIKEKVQAGIDLISFSGDKLLGGPQAGIIIGNKVYIDQLKSHQLARVLRVDKFTLAGLEATLKTYIRGQEQKAIPTVHHILESRESVLEKAQLFVEKVTSPKTAFFCDIKEDTSKIGGGTMPDVEIDTYVVTVEHDHYKSVELAEKLRNSETPIIVRVKNDVIMLDFRTVQKEELDTVIEAFSRINKEE